MSPEVVRWVLIIIGGGVVFYLFAILLHSTRTYDEGQSDNLRRLERGAPYEEVEGFDDDKTPESEYSNLERAGERGD